MNVRIKESDLFKHYVTVRRYQGVELSLITKGSLNYFFFLKKPNKNKRIKITIINFIGITSFFGDYSMICTIDIEGRGSMKWLEGKKAGAEDGTSFYLNIVQGTKSAPTPFMI
jgi:hypothetical protein